MENNITHSITVDISIIICTCNRSASIAKTLESLENNRGLEEISPEIIVVDNCSKDNTKEVVERFIKRGKLRINYLFEGKSGKSSAINKGIDFASGKIIAFTDDDVIVDKDWLSAINESAGKYSNYKCFGGRVIPVWDEQPPYWLGREGKYNSLRGTVFLRDDGDEDREFNKSMTGNTPGGVNMFFRREVVESVGYFRTDLGPSRGIPGGSEDTEFCRRMLMNGEKFMYVGRAVIYHPAERKKISKKYLIRWRYYNARTEIRSLNGNMPGRRIKGIPIYLFRLFINTLFYWSISFAPQKRFFLKMRLAYISGEMMEHYYKNKLQPQKSTVTV